LVLRHPPETAYFYKRGMNIVSSPPTAEAIRLVLTDKR